MVPLPMIVRRELVEGAEQATLSNEDETVKTLLPDRPHEAFRVGLGIGCLDGRRGEEHFPTTRTVDIHVLRLRQKLERDPERPVHFLTVHAQSYRFVA